MRRRLAGLLAFAALTGILAMLASAVPPLQITCATTLTDQVCHGTVTASLERGLAPFHPLILAAHVDPGSAGPTENGHRATVTFDLLGVPGPTTVRLFYDIGGHWGAVPDRALTELALWSLLAVAAIVGLGAASSVLLRRSWGAISRAHA